MSSNTGKLVLSLAVPLLVGFIAGYFTVKAIPGWYASLHQPAFSLPDSVFGPVWVTLYLIMGISCYLIWILPASTDRNTALVTFCVQLVLNFAWSFIFFYFKLIGFALVEIIVLWVAILIMIIRFKRVRPIAAYVNVPYLLWVTFATFLNGAYFTLN
ncbi:MAG TPA: TspO/MBR family protein [Chryseolinea sp.]|nr:TspO/MBR family protein [Chryseolinea sp.]